MKTNDTAFRPAFIEVMPEDYPIVKCYSASYANGDPSPWAQLVMEAGKQVMPDGELKGWYRYRPMTVAQWWAE